MKLTVGPLPSAVYWRRRAVVAGTLLLAAVALFYACSGNSGGSNASNASQRKSPQPPGAGASSTLSPAPSPVFTPASGLPAQVGEGGDSPPAAGPSASEPPAAPSSPCTDEEMSVTAVTEAATVGQGAYVKFTLRIKNVSNRSCTRDVGADAQELYLQDARAKVWSSDACDALHGTDVRTFRPGIEAQFWQVWDGKATSAGCADRKAPPSGRYELIGRLATKLSDPVAVELR